MQNMMLTDFLPTTKKELELRGWDYVDIIIFSGDAYVDHPSFGAAVIGRTWEAEGYCAATGLAWRLPRLQEAGQASPLLCHFTGLHGLHGQQIHRKPPPEK